MMFSKFSPNQIVLATMRLAIAESMCSRSRMASMLHLTEAIFLSDYRLRHELPVLFSHALFEFSEKTRFKFKSSVGIAEELEDFLLDQVT